MRSFSGKKLILSTIDGFMAQHVCGLLVNYGLQAEVKNTNLADIAVPRMIAPFEVWVDESSFVKAQEILSKVLAEQDSDAPDWKCEKCGESAEAQFTECWNCGASCPV